MEDSLFEDEKIVELPVDQRTITRRCTQKAIDFVKANKDKPFFVYVPHSMPHIPLYVPDDVQDPDPKNAYINTIEHIDTEVGRLLKTLDDLKLSDNTYVLYTTDNGLGCHFATMEVRLVLCGKVRGPPSRVVSVYLV